VFSLLVAGVDSSAILLSWALHWLSRSPEALDRLTGEVRGVEGPELLNLPYLQAVFLETLRMYPIVPTPTGRKLTREVQIGGRSYEAGTTLLPCPYLVHRRPDLYPEPEQFRPERFLGEKPPAGSYFPFGGGVRTCVGEMLAQVEFKTVLASTLNAWELEVTSEAPFTPVRHGTLLAPPDELRVTFHRRKAI
jgi:unspecific monooxygenase